MDTRVGAFERSISELPNYLDTFKVSTQNIRFCQNIPTLSYSKLHFFKILNFSLVLT
eukprot:UN17954